MTLWAVRPTPMGVMPSVSSTGLRKLAANLALLVQMGSPSFPVKSCQREQPDPNPSLSPPTSQTSSFLAQPGIEARH